ncbi:acyl-homoserine-lactone synthase [Cognatishimia sp. MH4019]|uniref:acyl-homoserine-lactone synthase n=1 Tax=Cognatishimia sp. MH4019 TaxID=2854030 RepID=UPI001CD49C09|nr:acyl-homoserine-lactone synthase [Cognatishimia sp. MH4019]
METTVIELPRDFAHYDLVRGFLELRKRVFIDDMAWSLVEVSELEFEQYDTFKAVYIIVHEGDEILAGARLLPTNTSIGTGRMKYSYMIKDAHDGHLTGMPSDLCFDSPPKSDTVWELTRLVSKPKTNAAKLVLFEANNFLRRQCAKTCLFLAPPAFLRLAKSMGFSPQRLGPIVGNEDGRFLAFSCDVVYADEVQV